MDVWMRPPASPTWTSPTSICARTWPASTNTILPFGIVGIRINNLDHFKAAYGRVAVDEVVNMIAESARNSIRPTDFVGRWGEDQFLVIALNCTQSGLEKVVQRIQRVTDHTELKWWGDQTGDFHLYWCRYRTSRGHVESLLARVGISEKGNARGAAFGRMSMNKLELTLGEDVRDHWNCRCLWRSASAAI